MPPIPSPRPAQRPRRPPKANNVIVTRQFLQSRIEHLQAAGYNKPKWIQFCERMIDAGLIVTLYEARRTVSKYVTVKDESGKRYKVRFSNHRPIPAREASADCNFFVGVTNRTVTTTGEAIRATFSHFGVC